VNTPWSDATTPASSLYSLSSLFRINIRKGERKRKNRMRRVKREERTVHHHHTHPWEHGIR
jgi:quercetin dioxygenase-like cupin family protein